MPYEVDSIIHEVSLPKIFNLNLIKSQDLQFTGHEVEDQIKPQHKKTIRQIGRLVSYKKTALGSLKNQRQSKSGRIILDLKWLRHNSQLLWVTFDWILVKIKSIKDIWGQLGKYEQEKSEYGKFESYFMEELFIFLGECPFFRRYIGLFRSEMSWLLPLTFKWLHINNKCTYVCVGSVYVYMYFIILSILLYF